MSAILSQEEIDRLAGSISDSLVEDSSANDKGVLSQEEISRITNSLGISDEAEEPEGTVPAVLSQEEIDKLASPEPEAGGGGMLTQEEIDRLSAMDSEPSEAPAPEAGGGGMLTQEEIDRLSAMDSEPSEAPAPEAGGGGMLTQEEIDRLSAMDSEPSEAPAPEAGGGGMLTQEEIDRLSAMDSEPSEAPAPEAGGGGMLTQEEIDRLSAMDSEPSEAPAPEAGGGGMLTQEEIDRLSAMDSEPSEAPAPDDGGGMLTQEEIDRLSAMDSEPAEAPAPDDGGGVLTQEEIDKPSEIDTGNQSEPEEEVQESEAEELSAEPDVADSMETASTGLETSVKEIPQDTVETSGNEEEEQKDAAEGKEKKASFSFNSKMFVLIGVPVVVITGLVYLVMTLFFSGGEVSEEPVKSGFSKLPAQEAKQSNSASNLTKGINLFVDSIVRDGVEATSDKSEELFYSYKLKGTEAELKKSFGFDLSASLFFGEEGRKMPDRFSVSEMRKRFVPAIRKNTGKGELEAETVMFDWGRAVIKDLKIKRKDIKLTE